MSFIDSEALDGQATRSESHIKSQKFVHPFSPFIPMISDLITHKVKTDPEINRNPLLQVLLDDDQIRKFVEQAEQVSFAEDPLKTVHSILSTVQQLDMYFLQEMTSIFKQKELKDIIRLSQRVDTAGDYITVAGSGDPNDLVLIFDVARIAVPSLFQDKDEYTKRYSSPTPLALTEQRYSFGPPLGRLGINEWKVDFRSFQENPKLLEQLLALS